MIVQKFCDRCGMEYEWEGVTLGDLVYCCAGCANGGPCTCPRTADETVVVSGRGGAVIVTDDDTVIVT